MSSPDHPDVALLRSTLKRTFRLTIVDRRVFTGTFVCIDRQRNIILDNTTEASPHPLPTDGGPELNPEEGESFERDVGMVRASPYSKHGLLSLKVLWSEQVMIPWKYVVSAEVEEEALKPQLVAPSWRAAISNGLYI